MNIIEEMAADRSSMAFETIMPIPSDADLVKILGRALYELARKGSVESTTDVYIERPTPAQITQALSLFHTWEAMRRV